MTRSLNDYPSYTGSYANSRAVVQQYLEKYPSIKIVLDVHRDAIETESGTRMAPVWARSGAGEQAAQVMIICGCDNGGSVQLPNWRQNLRFAARWETAMEALYPGFTRPVLFSYRFYNQDLTTGSLLIEIGGHGNNSTRPSGPGSWQRMDWWKRCGDKKKAAAMQRPFESVFFIQTRCSPEYSCPGAGSARSGR